MCTHCPHANRASTHRAARGRPKKPLRNQVQLLLLPVRRCPRRPAQRSILNGRHNGTLHGPAQQPRHKIWRLVVDSANGHVSHLPSWHALAPRPVRTADVSRLTQAAQRGEAQLTGYPAMPNTRAPGLEPVPLAGKTRAQPFAQPHRRHGACKSACKWQFSANALEGRQVDGPRSISPSGQV